MSIAYIEERNPNLDLVSLLKVACAAGVTLEDLADTALLLSAALDGTSVSLSKVLQEILTTPGTVMSAAIKYKTADESRAKVSKINTNKIKQSIKESQYTQSLMRRRRT